ncbi:unnamed protein product [Brassica oleracea]
MEKVEGPVSQAVLVVEKIETPEEAAALKLNPSPSDLNQRRSSPVGEKILRVNSAEIPRARSIASQDERPAERLLHHSSILDRS